MNSDTGPQALRAIRRRSTDPTGHRSRVHLEVAFARSVLVHLAATNFSLPMSSSRSGSEGTWGLSQ